ncbi:hypothetical protein BLA60_01665 [Actinophytocola xinjiangensis]|uniref:SsuA/THI5-like domain-containing protein n=1 Tax=Actinophytocola xinjiangensis TaxID=485602 RepID=A0A7Z0WS69_9PSEU|nr:hypothetical protein BLA60_01665 [Actinophytocola xinjiangensis]
MVLTATLALAACGDDGADAGGGGGGDTGGALTVGYISGASLAPAFVAEDLGCYSEQGLDVTFEPINNPADAIAFLSQRKIDAYVGSPSAGMFNQVARGATLKLVASLGSVNVPGDEPAPSGLYGGKDVATVEDLRGKRVASLGTVGTATSFLLGKALAEGGLTFADVEVVPLSVADMGEALRNGGVAAALLIAPYTQQAVDGGYAKELVDSKIAYGEETTSAVMYGPTLLEQDRDTGVAYLKAVACAAGRMTGDWRKDPEIVAPLAKFMKVPEETISGGGLYAFDPTLAINAGTLTSMQEMFHDTEGTLTYEETLGADKLVDDQIRLDAIDAS